MSLLPVFPFEPSALTPDAFHALGEIIRTAPTEELSGWLAAHEAWFLAAGVPLWWDAALARTDDTALAFLAGLPHSPAFLLRFVHVKDVDEWAHRPADLCRLARHVEGLLVEPLGHHGSLCERLAGRGFWNTLAGLDAAGFSLASRFSPAPLRELVAQTISELSKTRNPSGELVGKMDWLSGLAGRQPALFNPYAAPSSSLQNPFYWEHQAKSLFFHPENPVGAIVFAITRLGWSLDSPLEVAPEGIRGGVVTWRERWMQFPQGLSILHEVEARLLGQQLPAAAPARPGLRL